MVIISNLFISAAYYIGERYFYVTNLRIAKAAGLSDRDDVVKNLHLQARQMNDMYFTVFFFVTAVSVVVALYYSHRIAGPIYHAKKFLKDKIAGSDDEKILRFRKRDYFQDLAQIINSYREKFKP